MANLENFWGAIFHCAVESVEPLSRLEKNSTAKVNQLAGEPESRYTWVKNIFDFANL